MTDRQKKVLLGIFRDREFWAAHDRPTGRMDSDFESKWARTQRAREGYVACNPGRWLGESMTPSLYVMVGRTYDQLERAGLVRRKAMGYLAGRMTHVELTEQGELVARELEAADA